MTTLYVAVGGGLGVLARFGIGRLTFHHDSLLWSTVGINVVGSFLLGLLVAEHWFERDLREGLGVGFLVASPRSRPSPSRPYSRSTPAAQAARSSTYWPPC
jgi:fluoride ion exporter CrcB/FEX